MSDREVAAGNRSRRWLRRLAWLCALGVIGLVVAEGWHIFGSTNCHTVIPGRVYRCAQLSGPQLERVARKHGIRTIINLRGYCAPQDWYLEESRAAHRLNLCMEDVSMSAGRFPSTTELRRLVDVLDHTEYPVLIHCKQGADRTGLVASLILLLQTEATPEAAKRQLSLRYGHVALGRPANLDRYFGLYQSWLETQGKEHSPAQLRAWIAQPDCPMEYRAELEPLDFPQTVPAHKPIALHVRAHNRSRNAWRFQTERNAGYHACFALRGPDGVFIYSGRSGLFDAVVQPDASIDLTLALPALTKPGTYRLTVDLLDEPHCIFHQTGSEPLEWEFQVPG